MVINWDETPNDRASAVVAYRIKVKSKSNIAYEDQVNCYGADSSIVSSRSCSIPMTTLTGDPFYLEEGDLVVAVIESLNEIGYSVPSEENISGA